MSRGVYATLTGCLFPATELFYIHRLYTNLTANSEWMDDLHAADAILVATHSQGSIVSTHLLDRLIREKHIKTSRPSAQRVCCLALCGIHLGPLRYLSSSSLLQPYIQVGVSDSMYDVGVFSKGFHLPVFRVGRSQRTV